MRDRLITLPLAGAAAEEPDPSVLKPVIAHRPRGSPRGLSVCPSPPWNVCQRVRPSARRRRGEVSASPCTRSTSRHTSSRRSPSTGCASSGRCVGRSSAASRARRPCRPRCCVPRCIACAAFVAVAPGRNRSRYIRAAASAGRGSSAVAPRAAASSSGAPPWRGRAVRAAVCAGAGRNSNGVDRNDRRSFGTVRARHRSLGRAARPREPAWSSAAEP